MRSRYKIHNLIGIHFITSTTVNWIKIFNSKDYLDILVDSINFNIKEKKLKVFAYVLMKNHFHMICKADNLSNIIRSIKSYSAKKIIEQMKQDNNDLLKEFIIKQKNVGQYQVWQEGFHPKEIIHMQELHQKIDYIHRNPVTDNYCEKPTEWEYSSAEFYETEKEGYINVEKII